MRFRIVDYAVRLCSQKGDCEQQLSGVVRRHNGQLCCERRFDKTVPSEDSVGDKKSAAPANTHASFDSAARQIMVKITVM